MMAALAVGGLLAVAAVVVALGGLGTGSAHATGRPGVISIAPAAPGCPTVAHARFSLGQSFDGLPLTYAAEVCNRPPGGAGPTVPFTDLIYGTCHAVSDYGCPAPVEIQSWPQCARTLGSYGDAPIDRSLMPRALTNATSSPGLPVGAFDDGTRLELYTGDTTVVVFGDDARHASSAAGALVPQAVTHIAARLASQAARAHVAASYAAAKAFVERRSTAQRLRSAALVRRASCS